MTLHSAKGLEFPVVFMAGVDEGIFPSSRSSLEKTGLEEERRLMYVGVTRAEKKLYITSAKRRQMWGECKYFNPSRFIGEIPFDLIEEVASNSHVTGGTFDNAVRTIKSRQNGNYSGYSSNNTISIGAKRLGTPQRQPNYSSEGNTISRGARRLGTPQRQSNRTPARAMVVKSEANKKREEERVKAFFENNPMKRKLEERKRLQEEQAKLAKEREAQKNAPIDYFFSEGERVFHSQLGVGHVLNVLRVGDSTMYTIDFGKMGKQAMDAAYANLKKF